MGSSDRRMTSRLCYNFFRIGDFAANASLEERLVYAEYLCEVDSAIVATLRPDLFESIQADLSTKIVRVEADVERFFPLIGELSTGVDRAAFLQSQLVQPDLFIRIKRGKEDKVKGVLERQGMSYREVGEQALALANGSRLQDLKGINGDYEVQDWSSQRTMEFIEAEDGEYWWDACAGSGGKALMFLDRYRHTNLLVSDVRLSILRNLNERFEQAKVDRSYAQKVVDLTVDPSAVIGQRLFDGIILDVPCSGSGTWGRTPEMKTQFSKTKLDEFVSLQRSITSNVIPYLKSGSVLTYITCSVYKAENENVVRYIADRYSLQVEEMQVLGGYTEKADTMFVARLRKP